MKIVQIGPYPVSPDCVRGGVESSVFGLARELAKSHDVVVFDTPRIGGIDAVEKSGTLTIYRFRNPGKHNQDAVRAINRIAETIEKIGPDICHIHGTGLFSARIKAQLERKGLKTIVTVHGLLTVEKKNALKRHFSVKSLYQYLRLSRVEKTMLNRSPEVIVDTEYVAETLRHYGLKRLPNMHVIPQGIDSHYYGLQCSPDSNLILSVGSFSRRKGHLYLLQAFDILCERGVDARLVIAGVCSDCDYYAQMQAYLQSSPHKDRIEIRANLSAEDLDNAYRSAHFFALHSEEESQGIVFAEAMAAGLPVVSTNVGGIPYVVSDGNAGYLSDYGDVNAFADNMEKLMTSSESWTRFSQNAVEVAKKYNWEEIGKSIVAEYLYN